MLNTQLFQILSMATQLINSANKALELIQNDELTQAEIDEISDASFSSIDEAQSKLEEIYARKRKNV